MKRVQVLASVAVMGGLCSGCGGGGGGGDPTNVPASTRSVVESAPHAAAAGAPSYSSLVVFGDSLSDVGSYRTPGVAAIGGGQYTVNGPRSANWTELLARELALGRPCPAQTGLDASGPLALRQKTCPVSM